MAMDTLVQCETLLDSRQSERKGFETKELSEAEAIRRAQQGDAEGFERLYKMHSGRVYALCLRMMKWNASEAEDLTQEAFLRMFRKIDTFRAESAFSTWLHRLTFNIVLMRLRKKTVAEMISLEETNDPEEEKERLRKEIGGPDPRLSGLVDQVNLQRAVNQLPLGYRSIFLLHDVKGYEHNEIAKMLGCSIGNSKSQLHKARVILRQLLLKGKRSDRRRKRKESAEISQPIYELTFANPLVGVR
jgi:RNA polymerase sigma-70 factor, ECF subfamily